MMLLMLFCLMMVEAEWQTTETGVFQPLKPSEVVVRSDGAFYVKNFNDSQVRLFGSDGQWIKTIGRKGKGPGEFTYPVDIFYAKDRLYVFDLLTVKVSIFDKEGQFIEAIEVPGRGLILHKHQAGWVYGDWGSFRGEDEPAFYWTNSAFKEKKMLMELKDAGFSRGSRIMSDGSKTVAEYSPIDNRPKIAVSPDGSRIYFSSIDGFKITVFAADTGEVLQTIRREEPRIPFDEEWAEEQFKESTEKHEKKYKFKKNYPEYFPPVRTMRIAYDGTILIDRWRGRPDDHHYPLALTPEGKETSMKHKFDTYLRLAGIHENKAYVIIFNSDDEEAGVAKCALKDVDDFVAANPMEFDGSSGYSISISN